MCTMQILTGPLGGRVTTGKKYKGTTPLKVSCRASQHIAQTWENNYSHDLVGNYSQVSEQSKRVKEGKTK